MRRRTFVMSGLGPLVLGACGGGGDDEPADAAIAEEDAKALADAEALAAPSAHRAIARTVRLLPPVNGTQSAAFDVNLGGDVVGFTGAGEAGDFGATRWRRDGATRYPTLGGIGSGQARSVNRAGHLVGSSTTADLASHATLWLEGRIVDLGVLGDAVSSAANAINDAGLIVGRSYLGRGTLSPSHGVLWRRGTPTDLGTLGGNYSSALDLNEAGVIVGTSTTGLPDGTHAVVWRNGTVARLPDLGGFHSYAQAINEWGHIVGSSELPGTDGPMHATLWRRGTLVDLGTLGGRYATAHDINNAGWIVGAGDVPDQADTHAVLWVNRRAIDLNRFLDDGTRTAGWTLATAWAINDLGTVVGAAIHQGTGAQRGFAMSLWGR